MDINKRILDIENRLFEIRSEREDLISELNKLKKLKSKDLPKLVGSNWGPTAPATPLEKIKLFLKFFRCREDVFPRFWVNEKKGTAGYSPVCKNEWKRGICNKKHVKCTDCENQNFTIFDESIAKRHLQGEEIIGTYAIREDDTCVFLAGDFDKSSWQEDILEYKKTASRIDIGMLQTLSNIEDEDFFTQYGQVIIDECHHIPAFSFESVLKRFNSKYFLGLTATPYRKDGHQAILFMQCGPIRYELSDSMGDKLDKIVQVRETNFKVSPSLGPRPAIHVVWEKLIADDARLELIASDIIDTIKKKRFPLVISERKEHLHNIANKISALSNNSEIETYIPNPQDSRPKKP